MRLKSTNSIKLTERVANFSVVGPTSVNHSEIFSVTLTQCYIMGRKSNLTNQVVRASKIKECHKRAAKRLGIDQDIFRG